MDHQSLGDGDHVLRLDPAREGHVLLDDLDRHRQVRTGDELQIRGPLDEAGREELQSLRHRRELLPLERRA